MLPRGANVAPGDLDSADLQFFLINPEMDVTPDAPFGTARRPERALPRAMSRKGCLRACHSPSPSTLMPVLSISRCSDTSEPHYGMFMNCPPFRPDSLA